jgi:hypothetical protein
MHVTVFDIATWWYQQPETSVNKKKYTDKW